MSLERALFLLASTMVIASTLLDLAFPNGYWQWFTLFVGVNMLQSTFTGFCPPKFVFKKLGIKSEAEMCQVK
ncbi:MAG: DUF2892 domain-containing protein [gamma proteobacterium symbiont of Bathyaustriella thionipta]|nr:DUF2892 domain-containing protein [gamma proteobacterium symbiont of Bathyaustriella thionipta]MCU7950588.1 DUF2892 domain-containing protein [gamma proteobacterium symbiont of Bathyaustriella thionipta]MCU7952490.1 DUF2892 domain-containing protein [gamma proteobacterium symbiont of Bathyaustriella thionipta]MCU7957096.1 DUF2892 domain-containing protein [gamma proteobacterium symbiont of Bathyaustriella thionipta]MCU7967047.1 DUF2892 domain-containing protein [gamma proteobacterium symbion